MTEFQGQWIDHKGNNIRPHVSVVMNFTKPTEEKPALLTLGEVETFLHEFGHSLHGMFANTRFESLSGTNVWWDFVELPSQFMENYAIEKDFLRTFAFHYQTSEPLPDELIERIMKSRNFMAAYGCLRQVSFGLLDMAYYTQKKEFTADIMPYEKEAWKKAMILPQLQETCMTVQFSHIMQEVTPQDIIATNGQKYWMLMLSVYSRRMESSTRRLLKVSVTTYSLRVEQSILWFSTNGSADKSQPSMHCWYVTKSRYNIKDKRMANELSKQTKLDLRYLRMARIWAENSYCKRRQVGALVVKDKMIISDGYNGTPSGFENVCEDNNVTKPYVLHAEANAITKLARSSNNSEGSTLYVTASPCIECAKLIIQSGIKRVVYAEKYRLDDGIKLMQRAGIKVEYLNPDEKTSSVED